MSGPAPGEPLAAYAIRRRHEAGELTREAALDALVEAFGEMTRAGAELLLDRPEGLGKTPVVTRWRPPQGERCTFADVALENAAERARRAIADGYFAAHGTSPGAAACTSYVGAEFAEDVRQAEQRGHELRLTTLDVERVTGVELRPGLVIEYQITGTRGRVRVLDGADVLADWAEVELQGAGDTTQTPDCESPADAQDAGDAQPARSTSRMSRES